MTLYLALAAVTIISAVILLRQYVTGALTEEKAQ